MNQSSDSRIVLGGLGFPEGLRWHEGELWFADMRSRKIASVGEDGRSQLRAYVPTQPAGLGWLPDGTLLATSMFDQCVVAFRDDWRHLYADLGEFAIGQVNDLLVDPDGRAYVGSIGLDLRYAALGPDFIERLEPAPLVVVAADGTASVAAEDFLCANGMALSADGGTLIVAESGRQRIVAFDRNADGTLGNRRIYAELDAMPDGICIDREDNVWVALLGAERFVRLAEGGEVLGEIATPGASAVDCVLGGPEGRTLYGSVMYTPGTAFSYDGELDGAIEAWEVEVPGPA